MAVQAGKHVLNVLQHPPLFIFVDGHEFDGQAAVGAFFVLPHKPVALKPACQRRFGCFALKRAHFLQLGIAALVQSHARAQFIHSQPARLGPALAHHTHEVVGRGFDVVFIFQNDPIDIFFTVMLHRRDRRQAFAVINFQPNHVFRHDIADGNGPARGAHQRMIGLARMRLRVAVGVFAFAHFTGARVHIVMALRRAVDAIGPVQPGVEPLRRIGRGHLMRQHVHHLVVKRTRIIDTVEIAVFPAPVRPGSSKAMEHLPGIVFVRVALLGGKLRQRFLIRHRTLQPFGNALFGHFARFYRHTGFAEIFLRNDVRGHLRPERRHLHIVHLEDNRAVRVADDGRAGVKLDGG